MAKTAKPLNPREMRFVLAYVGQANGNGKQAALMAGYAKNGVEVHASRMLRRPNVAQAIQDAIMRRAGRAGGGAIKTAAERDRRLSEIIDNPAATLAEQMTAIKELNKVEGRHIVKIEGQVDVVHHTPESLMRLSDAELAKLMKDEAQAALELAKEFEAQRLALPAKAEPEKKGKK